MNWKIIGIVIVSIIILIGIFTYFTSGTSIASLRKYDFIYRTENVGGIKLERRFRIHPTQDYVITYARAYTEYEIRDSAFAKIRVKLEDYGLAAGIISPDYIDYGITDKIRVTAAPYLNIYMLYGFYFAYDGKKFTRLKPTALQTSGNNVDESRPTEKNEYQLPAFVL